MEQKNKFYATPKIDVIEISSDDIITLSNGKDNEGYMPGGWVPINEE